MVSNFFIDLNNAKVGEQTVLHTLSTLAPHYTFIDTSSDPSYYHKGDIMAIDESGNKHFIEVKTDSRIAATQNVLLEDAVDYYDSGKKPGNLHSNYEIYCVVSPQRHKVAIMDFSVLRAHAHEGTYKVIPHDEQTTYAYLLPIARIEQLGGIIAIIDYETNEVTYKRN